MSDKGRLIVVSGPSGVGKSTVIGKVMERRRDVCFSVSVTTRAPRPGEIDGVDYFFITTEEFRRRVERGELLEHAEYVGSCYGTPREYVENKLAQGLSVILDIEVQGAAQVRDRSQDACSVFILPPSSDELERRLRNRKTDSEEKIQCRLKQAKNECAEAYNYDYIVINDVPELAAEKLDSIITAEKCRAENKMKLIKEVIGS